MKKGIWKPSLAALVTGIAIFFVVGVLNSSETKRFQEQERADILNQLSTVRSRLEASINSTLLNESALGVNLAAMPHLKKIVEQTIKTRKQIVAGSANLVQGGVAFINRTVVYVTPPDGKPESGNYWGLVSVLVKPDVLYKKAGLLDRSTELNYALRGKDGLGAFRGIISYLVLLPAYLLCLFVSDIN